MVLHHIIAIAPTFLTLVHIVIGSYVILQPVIEYGK